MLLLGRKANRLHREAAKDVISVSLTLMTDIYLRPGFRIVSREGP
jgi:hypothetical protein